MTSEKVVEQDSGNTRESLGSNRPPYLDRVRAVADAFRRYNIGGYHGNTSTRLSELDHAIEELIAAYRATHSPKI